MSVSAHRFKEKNNINNIYNPQIWATRILKFYQDNKRVKVPLGSWVTACRIEAWFLLREKAPKDFKNTTF